MELFFILIIAAFLGIIPGKIAQQKGHNFWLWWFYGWMLFIVAILHVQLIDDLNKNTKDTDIISELEYQYKLLKSGEITEEQYQKKKKDILGI